LAVLPEVRAVIFDVYGTLVVSGSGDVGSADTKDPSDQMGDAFAAVGVFPPFMKIPSFGPKLRQVIQQSNEARMSDACPKPEVDIVDAWRTMLKEVGLADLANDTQTVVKLAAEYEARANPTWPMPGAKELLGKLRSAGNPLGIVSNAQQFTLSLVSDLSAEAEEAGDLVCVGFDLNLCFFSNRFRQSKPGPRLFKALNEAMRRQSIRPEQAVYVGNDMLNDVYAASEAGLRTAWFAGDARSCRPRTGDPRCDSLQPDIVITDLLQLLSCIVMDYKQD
jgi:putative hydrolase of the HAD superfamily